MIRSVCWRLPKQTPALLQSHVSQFFSTNTQKAVKNHPDSTDWIRVYRFPFIVGLRGFSRFKIWQTVGAIGITPFVISAHQAGQLSQEFAVGSIVGSFLATATLYAVSYFSRNLVGIVSVNPKDETLRIGRLTFWGRRVNDIFPKSDIVPICDIGENPTDIWLRVYRYSKGSKDPYFLVLRFGGVDQPDLFRSIFGSYRDR